MTNDLLRRCSVLNCYNPPTHGYDTCRAHTDIQPTHTWEPITEETPAHIHAWDEVGGVDHYVEHARTISCTPADGDDPGCEPLWYEFSPALDELMRAIRASFAQHVPALTWDATTTTPTYAPAKRTDAQREADEEADRWERNYWGDH